MGFFKKQTIERCFTCTGFIERMLSAKGGCHWENLLYHKEQYKQHLMSAHNMADDVAETKAQTYA